MTKRHSNTPEQDWALDTFVKDGLQYGRVVENDDVIICEIVGALDACGNSEAAQLIVAAPKLLRALKGILGNTGGRCTPDQWKAGLDAVKRAEGL